MKEDIKLCCTRILLNYIRKYMYVSYLNMLVKISVF